MKKKKGKISFELILPKGTHAELVELVSLMLNNNNLKISGEITTEMALILGYKLAQICKSVSILESEEKK